MKNRPEMQMSHCDDEDESASSGAGHKGGFGLIRSWPGGWFSEISPACCVCVRVEKACGGASMAETRSLASAWTWWRSRHKAARVLHPPSAQGRRLLSRLAGLEGPSANTHLNFKVNRSAVAPATWTRPRGSPIQRQNVITADTLIMFMLHKLTSALQKTESERLDLWKTPERHQ